MPPAFSAMREVRPERGHQMLSNLEGFIPSLLAAAHLPS